MLALACRDCANLLLREFWRENLQRLKDWRGGFSWRQVANGGFGRGAPSRPIINHTATEPNYMIKPQQLPIHNMPLSPLQGGLFLNMATPKTDHNMVVIWRKSYIRRNLVRSCQGGGTWKSKDGVERKLGDLGIGGLYLGKYFMLSPHNFNHWLDRCT